MLMYQDGCTALLWATLHDRAAMVTLLLDGGASIDNASKVLLMENSEGLCCVEYICLEGTEGGRDGGKRKEGECGGRNGRGREGQREERGEGGSAGQMEYV